MDDRKTLTTNHGFADHISRHGFAWFSVLYSLFVALPFLAPALMHTGAEGPAKVIYTIYSFLCHQLPERSFFLFGPQMSYSLAEIQAQWQPTSDPLVLRQYIGSASAGWKVAWSDRMVSMYTSVLLFAWLWRALRSRIPPLPLYGFVLLSLPMFVDGVSHMISDLAGIEQGFRSSNAWLVVLTQGALPQWFYQGDALGSFNSWMRLLIGTLFGLGAVWFLMPILDRSYEAQKLLRDARQQLRDYSANRQ